MVALSTPLRFTIISTRCHSVVEIPETPELLSAKCRKFPIFPGLCLCKLTSCAWTVRN